MKLTDIVATIEEIDDELIIFQEDKSNFNADIILSTSEEGDETFKEEDGKKYHYLLEIFLAKEFIQDWVSSLDYSPSIDETAKRLYEYAINDA